MLLMFAGCVLAAGCGTPFSDGSGYEWGHTGAGSFDNNPFNLAPFGSPALDGNGILYTLRSGTIDPDHIYGWARKTKSYYDDLYDCLLEDRKELSSGYFKIRFEYPAAWTQMPPQRKQAAAHSVALEAAQYLAFNDGLWHEMATWYGYRTFPLISDFQSALSWEDLYSDRLGTVVAAEAIDTGGDFAKNVTRLTKEHLAERELVDTDRARDITAAMKNKAYRNDPLAKVILWRNMDIGSGDGQINPVVFAGFTDKPPIALAAPTLSLLDQHGIQGRIVVSSSAPKYAAIKSKAQIKGDYEPAIHNPKILAVIKADAIKRGFQVFD
ncbi:MAG: DUF4056 domain-containing protein [Planctomycetaceae bacterium]|nr:DUF4056 domain-containing protein [Planctomycetaceae bacterium]